ncbi:long-chain fatty acid--CoA ligase, partial [Streptomyces cirratus]
MHAEPKAAEPAEPVKTVIDGVVRQVAVPALVGPPARGSLGDIPFDNAAEAPGGAAVLARKEPDGSWRDVSAAEFAAEVLAVAKGLIAEGL